MITMFGMKIKHLRKLLRLTLEEVAQEIGSGKSYIWELENKDIARPSAETVFRLAKLFSCPMEYLIDDSYNIGTYPDPKPYCIKCAKIKSILGVK